MSLQYPDFLASHSMRSSLKRGLARQAVAHAAAHQADIPAIVADLACLSPNRKALERALRRIAGRVGVARASLAAGGKGLILVLRNTREVVARQAAQDLFAETALVYTRVQIIPAFRNGLAGFNLQRAGFCLHAMERLVERTCLALDRQLLPTLDIEAVAVLRQVAGAALLTEDQDDYAVAIEPGVWAGRLDLSPFEEDWGLASEAAADRASFFSARTFLGPGEMRPVVWAKWRGDPNLTIA